VEARQTREELVRAFEHLSLLRLGRDAVHWNHVEIAGRLGEGDRRRTAEQLAGLYEKARYAPASDPLPDAAIATARRDLCLLAGVPAA
jgi:hypothetical protein